MWSLAWWPHALSHGLNPLITHAVWAPNGYNLTWATTIPGPSLAVSPITIAAGPIAAYNVLALLAAPLAAWTTFLLCRHVTRTFWPSVLAGYVFGFSSYQLGHLRGQVNLVLVFLVPLLVLLVLRRLEGVITQRRFVVLLVALLLAQLSISTEILATVTVFGVAALLLGGIFGTADIRARLLGLARPMLTGYAITAAIVSPFLYFMVWGPGITKRFNTIGSGADLLNFAVPTDVTRLGGTSFQAVTDRFTGPLAGHGAYLGLPLLVILVHFVARNRRSLVGKILASMLVLTGVASLGPSLKVGGHQVMPLPWRAMGPVPLVNKALPGRFTMYVFLISALVVAVWLTEAARRGRWRWRWMLAGLAVVSLLPAAPAFWKTTPRQPAFFATGEYTRYLPPHANILVLSPGAPGEPMLWQAQARMGFAMASGYLGAIPEGLGDPRLAKDLYHGRLPESADAELRSFLENQHVQALVVERGLRNLELGIVPEQVGGVRLYLLPNAKGSPAS